MSRDILFYWYYGCARIRAIFFRRLTGIPFKSVGINLKVFGASSMRIVSDFSVGDNCWLQAIQKYKNQSFCPSLHIGKGVSLSDSVHISCADEIYIGDGTLVGSNVYFGDHSHGSNAPDLLMMQTSPAYRPLEDLSPIYVGKNVWIGDGARILAGTCIPDGSIIGANAIVKSKFETAGLIAGVPATLKKEF